MNDILHELFIAQANRPMNFGRLPVTPSAPIAPVLAVDRWKESNGALYKTYRFRRIEARNDFVVQLLSYEMSVGHNSQLTIENDTVNIKVQTKDIGKVTELDKEYAKYADVLFRGLVYYSSHGDEG
jgi:pterin-4a-carbinolamine dehydratase